MHQKLFLVARVANRACGNRAESPNLRSAKPVRHSSQHAAGLVYRRSADHPAPKDGVAETSDLAVFCQQLWKLARTGLSGLHADRIAADVDSTIASHSQILSAN
jgi:hypothetical protein